MPAVRTGGQPPNPRPRREAGIGGLEPPVRSGTGNSGLFHRIPVPADPCQQGISPQARQGSAAPTATPRRRALTRRLPPGNTTCKPGRRARVAVALDPPPTLVDNTNPAALRRPEDEPCPRSLPQLLCLNNTSEPAAALNPCADRSGSPSHWKTLTRTRARYLAGTLPARASEPRRAANGSPRRDAVGPPLHDRAALVQQVVAGVGGHRRRALDVRERILGEQLVHVVVAVG